MRIEDLNEGEGYEWLRPDSIRQAAYVRRSSDLTLVETRVMNTVAIAISTCNFN